MDNNTQLPVEKCPECGGLNGGHGRYNCSRMTLEYAQKTIVDVEQRWIKINAMSAANTQRTYLRLKRLIHFNQGKVAILKAENNKLRKENAKLKQQATGWRPLLEEVLSRHNTGRLPDHSIYEKIKKFLYGE